MNTHEQLTDFARVQLRMKGSDKLDLEGYKGASYGQENTDLLRACTECPKCGWVQSWMQRGWAVRATNRIALPVATLASTACCAVVMWFLERHRSSDLPPVAWGMWIFSAAFWMTLSCLIVGVPTARLVRKFIVWPRVIRRLTAKEAGAGSPPPIMPQIAIKAGSN